MDLLTINKQINSIKDVKCGRGGNVYLIWAMGTNRYKIGRSSCIYSRYEVLNNQSPFPLQVLSHFWTIDAPTDENLYHRYYKQYRQHGEWFDFSSIVENHGIEANELNFDHFWDNLDSTGIKGHCYYNGSPTLNILFEIHKQKLLDRQDRSLCKLDKMHVLACLAILYESVVDSKGFHEIEFIVNTVMEHEIQSINHLLPITSNQIKKSATNFFKSPDKIRFLKKYQNLGVKNAHDIGKMILTNQEFLIGILSGARLRLLGKNLIEKYNLEMSVSLPTKQMLNSNGFGKAPYDKTKKLDEVNSYLSEKLENFSNSLVTDEDRSFAELFYSKMFLQQISMSSRLRKNICDNYMNGVTQPESFHCKLSTGILLGARMAILRRNLEKSYKEFTVPNTGIFGGL